MALLALFLELSHAHAPLQDVKRTREVQHMAQCWVSLGWGTEDEGGGADERRIESLLKR